VWQKQTRQKRLVRKMAQRLQGRNLVSTFQEWVKWVLHDKAAKEREAFRAAHEADMEKLRAHMAESASTQNMTASELAEARARHDAAAAELQVLRELQSDMQYVTERCYKKQNPNIYILLFKG
jgi:Na+-transporting NADH:ubiquinone oxidoreductase subunit NqrC